MGIVTNQPSFTSLGRRSTTSAVVDAIQAMIVEQRLKPGDALPSERELATQFAVSRNVLREALSILGQRGLLNTRHGTGTYVSLPSSRQARDAFVLLLELGQVSLVELCDARILIEPELAYRAALRDDEAGRQLLRKAYDDLRSAEDGERHVACDLAFHGAIAGLANHAVLRALVDAVKEPVMRGMVLGTKVPRAIEDSNRQHDTIFATIMDRDATAARTEMHKHILYVQSYLSKHEIRSGAPEPSPAGATRLSTMR